MRVAARLTAAAAGAALLLAALVAALLVAISYGWQREKVRQALERALSHALEAEVSIGSVEGRLYRELGLRDLTLSRPGEEPLRISSLEAHLDWSRVLDERLVVIESLSASGARIAVSRRGEAWQVEGLGALGGGGAEEPAPGEGPEEPPPPLSVEIRSVEVRDTAVAVSAPAADRPTRIAARLELDARGLHWPVPADAWPQSASLRLELEPSEVVGRRIETGRIRLAMDGPRLRIERAQLAGPFGRVALEGRADLARLEGPVPAARGEIEVQALDLEVLAGEPRLRSSLDGTVTLASRPAAGGGARLELRGSLRSRRTGEVGLRRIELEGTYTTDTDAWRIARASLAGELGRVDLSGSGSGERLESLELAAQRLHLGRLPERWLGGSARGTARLHATLEGPLRDPRGPVELAVDSLAWEGREIGDVALRATSLGDRRVRVERASLEAPQIRVATEGTATLRLLPGGVELEDPLRLRTSGGSVEIAGRLDSGVLTPLHVEASGLDAAALGAIAGLRVPLGGELTARFRATGPVRAPQIEGRARWDSPRAGEARAERLVAELRTGDGLLHASARLTKEGRRALSLRGALPLEALAGGPQRVLAAGATRLDLEGEEIDLAWLAPAVRSDALELRAGLLSTRIELRGGDPQPALRGFVEVRDGRVRLRALERTLGPIEGRVELAGTRARIESLRIEEEDGAVLIEGSVDWSLSGLRSVELRADLREVPVTPTSLVQGRLDGSIRVHGPLPELTAEGTVALRNATLYLPQPADPLLKEIRVRGLPEAEAPAGIRERPEAPGAFDALAADLTLEIPRHTRVSGRGADLEVMGELRLRKRPGGELRYSGALEVTRGHYELHGRQFDVVRGVATFPGIAEPDPQLDVRAEYEVADVILYVTVTGRASQPVVSLESEPPMGSNDMLAYLVFGRPASELESGQGMQLEAAATRLVAHMLADRIGTALGSRLPIDTLEVSAGGGDGPAVGLGKRVGGNVFVRFERGLSADGAQRVKIEWRFLPAWSLESEISTLESSGADLIWSLDY